MEAPVRTHTLTATRVRGPGSGAFERSRRAISPARRRGQPADLSTIHSGSVLSPPPAAGAHGLANTARDLDAEEPAATFVVIFFTFGVYRETVQTRSGRS